MALSKNTYIRYSCVFFLLLPIVFSPFLIEGKSFIWDTDGISQHFPILRYYGRLLRGILLGKGFPMIDFTIGLGFDTITTLHYYALGDPIALLTVFMTPANAVFMYGFLIIFRLYLIGISYIIFCRYWKKDELSVLLGALIYVFCGYSFYAGVRHPFFLNPMIFIPIILIGLEEVLRRKKPYLLIVMVFISTLSNFYFLFMITVISMIYVVYRYFTKYRFYYNKVIYGFFLTALRTGITYLLGITIAAFIFVPVVYAFMQTGRLESSSRMLTGFLHYNKGYYIRLLQGFFASGISPGYWVESAFSLITAISLVILISNKKYWKISIIFIFSIFALSVPAFGYLMNGFSYITNRWSFLISFIVAISFTMTYEKLFQLKRKEHILLAVGVVGYGILAYSFPAKDIVKIEFLLLLFTVIAVEILQIRWFKSRQQLQKASLFIIVCLTLGFQGYTYYSTQYNKYVNEFLEREEVEMVTGGDMLSLINGIEDDAFYRIETYGDKVKNEALCIGYNDVSGYFSLLDGNTTTYFKQLELLNQRNVYRFDNFDNRTILNALANVKYFVTTDKTAAPYAYKLINEEEHNGKKYYLFENLFALPLGYTYDSYMLTEDYNKLGALEKQNAMMYAAILDNACDEVEKTKQDMSAGIKKLDFDIITDQNVKLEENSIKVLKKDATITLEFKSGKKSETYVRFKDFDIKKRKAIMTSLKVKGEKEVTKYMNVRSMYHNTYFRNDYLVNTGYSKTEKSWIRITFPQKETYSFKELDVYSLDMKYVKAQINELNSTALKNISIENNKIQGDASLDKKGIMVLSIPYSIGWSAYVDGEKVELLKANIMHMALSLDAGEHQIVLKYETPLLKMGGLISLISVLCFVIIVFYHKKVK